jgi:hypothetical protein
VSLRARLARDRVTIVWVVLVCATVLSWQLGRERHAHDRQLVSVVVLLVALIKVRLVGLHFMELRAAPPALRMLLEGYVLLVAAGLLVIYFVV